MPALDRKLGICSHKRSGTHLLAATLWKNFQLPDAMVNAIVREGQKFVIGDQVWKPGSRAPIPWGGLWRSHNFFNPTWHKEPETTLYIVRNPVNTIMSYWRLMDPSCEKDREIFLGEARARFWFKHAKGYTKFCHWVKYEDLVGEKHDEVLAQIAEWFSLEPRFDHYERVEEHVGWYPLETTRQPKRPPRRLLESLRGVLPKGFLGYTLSGA